MIQYPLLTMCNTFLNVILFRNTVNNILFFRITGGEHILKKLLVVIIILIFVLVLTNPSQADYNSWINGKLADQLNYDSQGTLGKAISKISDLLVEPVTERQNYILFSIYETRVANTQVTKTLGILKFFIDLK